MMLTNGLLILDLCGGTGAWSHPYLEAGYDVRVVDPVSDKTDVRTLERLDRPVHGILAAPPCTHLAVSGARWWNEKGAEVLLEALSVVDACLRVVWAHKPKWWALENPVGRLAKYLGPPTYSFQPYEYGDPWLKKTCIWGVNNKPTPKPVPKPEGGAGRWRVSLTNHLSPRPTAEQMKRLVETGMVPADWVHRLGPCPERATIRSMTPPGFARAFFEANP